MTENKTCLSQVNEDKLNTRRVLFQKDASQVIFETASLRSTNEIVKDTKKTFLPCFPFFYSKRLSRTTDILRHLI